MTRTPEQLAYHADKQRQYRQAAKREREVALMRLAEAAATLRRHGYTVGDIVDLVIQAEG